MNGQDYGQALPFGVGEPGGKGCKKDFCRQSIILVWRAPRIHGGHKEKSAALVVESPKCSRRSFSKINWIPITNKPTKSSGIPFGVSAENIGYC